MTDEILKLNDKKYSLTYKPAEISFPEYNQMEAQVDQLRDQLIDWRVTPENMKSSKNTRAELNKFKRALNKRRREITNSMTQSSKDFKAKIDVLTGEIGDVSDNINRQIKVYEKEATDERERQHRKQIEQMAIEAGVDPQKIEYNSKWNNKTFSKLAFQNEVNQQIALLQQRKKQLKQNIQIVVQKATDLSLPPEHWISQLKNNELSEVLKAMDQYKADLNDIANRQHKTKIQEAQNLEKHGDKYIDADTGEVKDKLITLRLEIQGTKWQMKQLHSFLKDNAIKYRGLEG